MTLLTTARAAETRVAFPSGVATVRRLVAAGISERTVYKRCLDGGPWQRILPGVILLFTGRPTRDQEVLAALLLCGDGAVVTGLEACRRYELRRGPVRTEFDRIVHVLVPHERQRRKAGFVEVERTLRMPAVVMRNGIPLAELPRACMDAARRLRSVDDVTELLAEPVQRRMCTVSALVHELESGSRRGTARPRAVLGTLDAGVRSAAERAANALWNATGLPRPLWNCRVYTGDGRLLGIADCWLDEVAMAWEIESTQWHLSPAEHARTVERAAEFTAAGVVYVASKPNKILRDPVGVAAMLRAAYAQAKVRPRPPLTCSPAPRA